MTPFDRALQHTLGLEGGFVDDAADSGGATRYGITESVARAFGYTGEMSKLPKPLAITIYRQQYWKPLGLEEIGWLSEEIAAELFDTAVNLGVSFAARSLQTSLNVFNNRQEHYPDLKVDGHVGQLTKAAARAFLDLRGAEGEIVLLRALNSLQGAGYIDIASNREKDERFVYGWMLNRVN